MTRSPMLSPRFEPWVRAGEEPERYFIQTVLEIKRGETKCQEGKS